MEYKLLGNQSFQSKDYPQSFLYYTLAIESSDFTPLTTIEKAIIYSNRAFVSIVLKKYKEALEDAKRAIDYNGVSYKSYFRKAIALYYLEDTSYVKYIAIAIALEPKIKNDELYISLFKSIYNYKSIAINPDNPEEIHTLSSLDKIVKEKYDYIILLPGIHIISNGEIKNKCSIIGLGKHESILQSRYRTMGTVDTLEILKSGIYIENVYICGDQNGCIHISTDISSKDVIVNNGLFYIDKTLPKIPIKQANFCVKLENCKLTSSSGGRHANITVRKGSVLLINCTIEKSSGDGVMIRGAESLAVIAKSNIQFCCAAAINISNGGRARIEDSKVFNCEQGVIGWQYSGCIQIFSSTISDCHGEGFLLTDPIWSSEHHSPESDASQDALSCTLAIENPTYILQNSNIYANNGYGVTLQEADKAIVYISNCNIIGNKFWGIFIQGGTAANIIKNNIVNNLCGGIRIGINYNSPLSLKNNNLHHNFGYGIFSDMHDAPRRAFLSKYYIDALQKFKSEIINNSNHKKPTPPFTLPPKFIENKCLDNIQIVDDEAVNNWMETNPNISTSEDVEKLMQLYEFSNILNPIESEKSIMETYLKLNTNKLCMFCFTKLTEELCKCDNCDFGYCNNNCKVHDQLRHKIICVNEEAKKSKLTELMLSLPMPNIQDESLLATIEDFVSSDIKFLVSIVPSIEQFDESDPQQNLQLTILSHENLKLISNTKILKMVDDFTFKFTNERLYNWIMLYGTIDIINLTAKRLICYAKWEQLDNNTTSKRKRKTIKLFLDKFKE